MLGTVKTRIAKTAGDEKALRIYKALMTFTRDLTMQIDAERLLFYSNEINFEDEWPNEHFTKLQQASGDLGDRMSAAFQLAFQRNNKVIIIGSDCASLKPGIITTAFEQLDKNGFVIGPTFDGGYYLLGMSTFRPQIFQNINWSTETVFEETIKRMNSSYYLLPTLSDIDYEEDWEKYGWKL